MLMVSEAELRDLLTTGLKTWFHDCFLGDARMDTSVNQTGSVTQDVASLLLNTGVQQGSFARANYSRSFFNPRYAALRAKLRLNGMDDVTAFVGFKSTLTAPVWGMTESCAGLFIDAGNDNGVLYWYTGNGSLAEPAYQATPVMDVDMTRWLVFELEHHRMRYYSLPYTVPYFDKNVLPGIKQGIIRKWSGTYANGTTLPGDEMHYLVFYVSNATGYVRTLEAQYVDYSEVYPD
jgi:hypothetical protein